MKAKTTKRSLWATVLLGVGVYLLIHGGWALVVWLVFVIDTATR